MGVKACGVSPKMLKDRMTENKVRIKGAQGLEVGPAGCRSRGGRVLESLFQGTEIREGKWLGEISIVIQESAMTEAGRNSGRKIREGRLN